MYNLGDFVSTTKGFLQVQCSFKFKDNTNPRYDKIKGGRTLYWFQDEQFQDVLLWDTELSKILTTHETDNTEDTLLEYE